MKPSKSSEKDHTTYSLSPKPTKEGPIKIEYNSRLLQMENDNDRSGVAEYFKEPQTAFLVRHPDNESPITSQYNKKDSSGYYSPIKSAKVPFKDSS